MTAQIIQFGKPSVARKLGGHEALILQKADRGEMDPRTANFFKTAFDQGHTVEDIRAVMEERRGRAEALASLPDPYKELLSYVASPEFRCRELVDVFIDRLVRGWADRLKTDQMWKERGWGGDRYYGGMAEYPAISALPFVCVSPHGHIRGFWDVTPKAGRGRLNANTPRAREMARMTVEALKSTIKAERGRKPELADPNCRYRYTPMRLIEFISKDMGLSESKESDPKQLTRRITMRLEFFAEFGRLALHGLTVRP